jgi:subtilisin-like proprotein convertase family protein
MRVVILTVVLFFGIQLNAQQTAMWLQVLPETVQESQKIKPTVYSENQQLYKLDLTRFKRYLENAHDKFSKKPGVIVTFPNIQGEFEEFIVWENSNFEEKLQDKFPNIKSYVGHGLKNKATTISFSLAPQGIQTILFRPDVGTEFIEPYTKDQNVYVAFDTASRIVTANDFICTSNFKSISQNEVNQNPAHNRSNNQVYKTMRLALSCTGEYAQYFGGTIDGAIAAMNATMTRVNAIFEKDLALHLNLIENNESLIYLDPNTDPYSPSSQLTNWNAQLQSTITNSIGESNYDIGHLFGATGGGGNGGCLGCVCENGKGSGYTSPSNSSPFPEGDFFDIDYVAHEIGHQLGANHTFSYLFEGSGVNVEPGSGSTIMAYAGITTYNVQQNSDAYFTNKSILQIQNNLATKTCPVALAIANLPPIVDAGEDFSVPANTPYQLKGSALDDANNDSLTYCWEQNDVSSATTSGANSVASPTKATGPNFRSFIPKVNSNRTLPDWSKINAATLNTTWESLSSVARTSNFILTVRDNSIFGAQTNFDDVTVTSLAPSSESNPNGVGPFAVTSQNTHGVLWIQGTLQTILWTVNNTTSLPGSNTVNIKLSTDGGITFPYFLATETPNDGMEVIEVPNVSASANCRILIEPTANHYFAVNQKPFYIGYELVNSCETYTLSTPFNLPDGASTFTSKMINVPVEGNITDVNISLDLTHPNIQNLIFAVIRPLGSLATLFNQQCLNTANLALTFDSDGNPFSCLASPNASYVPPTGFDLNSFNGFNQQGNWQFGFKDVVTGNEGTVNSIALEICALRPQLLPDVNFEFDDFSLYPNPNNGDFTMQFHRSSSPKVRIEVFDVGGRKIYHNEYDTYGVFNQNIKLNQVSRGIYLVAISNGNKRILKKISIN